MRVRPLLKRQVVLRCLSTRVYTQRLLDTHAVRDRLHVEVSIEEGEDVVEHLLNLLRLFRCKVLLLVEHVLGRRGEGRGIQRRLGVIQSGQGVFSRFSYVKVGEKNHCPPFARFPVFAHRQVLPGLYFACCKALRRPHIFNSECDLVSRASRSKKGPKYGVQVVDPVRGVFGNTCESGGHALRQEASAVSIS